VRRVDVALPREHDEEEVLRRHGCTLAGSPSRASSTYQAGV
jgi:hypothetical protein